MKSVKLFIVIYIVTAPTVFLSLFLTIRGFPFFPETIHSTTNETETFQLEKGDYTLLYYLEGRQEASFFKEDVGTIEIYDVKSGGERNQITSVPSKEYFDDANNSYGIRGQAVCSFYLPIKQTVAIQSHFKKYGYSGLMIRTSLKKLVVCIIPYEVFVILFSIGLTWFIRKRRISVHS